MESEWESEWTGAGQTYGCSSPASSRNALLGRHVGSSPHLQCPDTEPCTAAGLCTVSAAETLAPPAEGTRAD